MSSDHLLQCGRLYGAVRYDVRAPIEQVWHCHCSMCRKLHGAIFVSIGLVKRAYFALSGEDNMGMHKNWPSVLRRFCKTCGSQIISESDKDLYMVELALGSLDPDQTPGHADDKKLHIYWESKIAWYEPADDLPKTREYGDPLDDSQP